MTWQTIIKFTDEWSLTLAFSGLMSNVLIAHGSAKISQGASPVANAFKKAWTEYISLQPTGFLPLLQTSPEDPSWVD